MQTARSRAPGTSRVTPAERRRRRNLKLLQLLARGVSKADAARACGISRQHVHWLLDRLAAEHLGPAAARP